MSQTMNSVIASPQQLIKAHKHHKCPGDRHHSAQLVIHHKDASHTMGTAK
jgi:hypothetical protein